MLHESYKTAEKSKTEQCLNELDCTPETIDCKIYINLLGYHSTVFRTNYARQ